MQLSSDELRDGLLIPTSEWESLPQNILDKHAEIRASKKIKGKFFGIAKKDGKHLIVKRSINPYFFDVIWVEE